MNILTVIGRNLRGGTQTQRFPDRRPPAPAYRGRVVLDPATCRSCSKCAQVCVSAAITFERVEGDRYEWAYDPSRCTYCGICVDYCPVDCLRQEADRGSSYVVPGEQAETISVIKQRKKKKAPRAAPAAPAASATSSSAPAEPVPAEPSPASEGADHGR